MCRQYSLSIVIPPERHSRTHFRTDPCTLRAAANLHVGSPENGGWIVWARGVRYGFLKGCRGLAGTRISVHKNHPNLDQLATGL